MQAIGHRNAPDMEQVCEVQGEVQLRSSLNGHLLFCHQWKCRGSPGALLYLCHGVTEHTQRYKVLADHLAGNKILVFGHDHVGHGQSEGERVYIDSVDTYVQDVVQHIVEMKKRYPDLPCLLMGHSMGGLISAHVVVQEPDLVQGLILSSAPVARIYNTGPKIIVRPVVKMLAAIAPRQPLIPWDASLVSSMPARVAEFVGDPLVYHGRIRFSWVAAMISAMDALEECLHKISLPVLLLHGCEDSLVPISCSEHIYQAIASRDKILEVFPGNYHEVLHDCGRDKAINVIKQWILSHL